MSATGRWRRWAAGRVDDSAQPPRMKQPAIAAQIITKMTFYQRNRASIFAAVVIGAVAGGLVAYYLYWRAQAAPQPSDASADAQVDAVMAQAHCRRYVAVAALQQHGGDVAAAVKDLTAGSTAE